MLERLPELEAELDQLEADLPSILSGGDRAASRDAGRRHAHLRGIVDAGRIVRQLTDDIAGMQELLDEETSSDGKAELREMIKETSGELIDAEADLQLLLLPQDPNADKNVIVEIRGAEGGEEANLFAGDLARMYERFAERRGWKLERLNAAESDMGGFKEITFMVAGTDVWPLLKFEAGPHRVQRVPATESQGRVHTSAATVAVLPEAEEVDVHIDPNDLNIDVFRSSGPGGQSVNTTDSAVRITHLPTGTVVSCQDEKSQLQNKEKAMRILRSRLLQVEQERQAADLSANRKAQVGGGGRSEKIRTYNFKENRVTDHRIGLTLYRLEQILDGDLEEVVEGLARDERERLLSEAEQ
ncbi:MAG: peptide chain release factor 1 [Acidimicrobiia bacterium]|nr:peptide chain release factor 1 [Acidimicrobiia bacterium]MBP8179685.1 peptide chain release factor 1 [Acidimicrobiia bacterium]